MGATTSGVAVQGRKRSPVPSGESPRPSWKNSLVRYAAEKIALELRNVVVTAAVNVRARNSDSGIIGSAALVSQAKNAVTSNTAAASDTTVRALPQPACGPCTSPQMNTPMPADASTRAGRSSRSRGP